jgi:hypothetical protein
MSTWIHIEQLCPTKKKEKELVDETGLRLRDGEGDRHLGASTTCINCSLCGGTMFWRW